MNTNEFRSFEQALPADRFIVPVEYRDDVAKRIEKIARRAGKLSQRAPEVNIVETVEHTFKRSTGYGFPREVTLRYDVYEVIGEAPRVAGYDLIGSMNCQHSEAILTAAPGEELPIEAAAHAGNCDHCNERRRRNDTFVLRHASTGALRYVGRNCLADFLGGHDPSNVLRWLRYTASAVDSLGDPDSYGPRPSGFPLMNLLPMVAACIRTNGWVSRSMEMNDYSANPVTSTVSQAWTQMDSAARKKMREEDRITPTEEDYDEARAAIEWAATLSSDNSSMYLRNIGIIARDGFARWKEDGFAASIVSAYQREQERLVRAEREARKPKSEHFGTEKKREIFELTAESLRVWDGNYGTTYCYRFVLAGTGNTAVWYASREQDIEMGATYKIKATVKKHDTHEKYGKSTVITRGQVIELVDSDTADTA